VRDRSAQPEPVVSSSVLGMNANGKMGEEAALLSRELRALGIPRGNCWWAASRPSLLQNFGILRVNSPKLANVNESGLLRLRLAGRYSLWARIGVYD
jgi:hypothetical protein